MTHPLFVKKSTIIPYLAVGSGLALNAYGTAVRLSRDLGRSMYTSVPGIDLPSGPAQRFVDATVMRKILDQDSEELKELQANLIAEYYASKLKERRKRKD